MCSVWKFSSPALKWTVVRFSLSGINCPLCTTPDQIERTASGGTIFPRWIRSRCYDIAHKRDEQLIEDDLNVCWVAVEFLRHCGLVANAKHQTWCEHLLGPVLSSFSGSKGKPVHFWVVVLQLFLQGQIPGKLERNAEAKTPHRNLWSYLSLYETIHRAKMASEDKSLTMKMFWETYVRAPQEHRMVKMFSKNYKNSTNQREKCLLVLQIAFSFVSETLSFHVQIFFCLFQKLFYF